MNIYETCVVRMRTELDHHLNQYAKLGFTMVSTTPVGTEEGVPESVLVVMQKWRPEVSTVKTPDMSVTTFNDGSVLVRILDEDNEDGTKEQATALIDEIESVIAIHIGRWKDG